MPPVDERLVVGVRVDAQEREAVGHGTPSKRSASGNGRATSCPRRGRSAPCRRRGRTRSSGMPTRSALSTWVACAARAACFDAHPGAAVDLGADELVGRPPVGLLQPLGQRHPRADGEVEETGEQRVRDRGEVDLLHAGGPGHGRDRRAVREDVVRVAVEAVRVVGHDDLGPLRVDHRGDPRRDLVQVLADERARLVVLRPAHHPRVVVAQQLEVDRRRGGAPRPRARCAAPRRRRRGRGRGRSGRCHPAHSRGCRRCRSRARCARPLRRSEPSLLR